MRTAAGGTRWSRATAGTALGLVFLAAGVVGLSQNVLAASLTFQEGTSEFSTGRVTGADVAFGMVPIEQRNADGTTSTVAVLRAGFSSARLDGLCVSQVQDLPGWGSVTIRIEAGDGDSTTTEIMADNMQFDVTYLRGSGPGVNLDGVVQIGLASSDVTTAPGVANPLAGPSAPGWIAIDASAGDILDVRGQLHDATIGGPLALPGLRISVVPGGPGCDASPVAG